MKRSLFILILVTLLLAVLAVPSTARPAEIHSTANAVLIEVIDPGESTITGNMWHLRGFTLLNRVEGVENPDYQTGFNLSVVNWNWNLKNGNVSSWGTYELSLDAYDGGSAGTFTIEIAPNEIGAAGPDFNPADPATWPCSDWTKGEAVGRGYGELEGQQVRVTIDSSTCGAFTTYDAVMFTPGG
jgi:hypothetical protein